MTTTAFRIHAIPAEVLDRVRDTGLDTSGNPVEPYEGEGLPLRCCLRNSTAGERLILFGYRPDLPPSPYCEIGAVFAHAEPCEGPADADKYPAEWHGHPQILRSYDRRGWMHYASTRVHDGSNPAGEIADIFANPEVVQIHSRNVAAGCYMFQITRG